MHDTARSRMVTWADPTAVAAAAVGRTRVDTGTGKIVHLGSRTALAETRIESSAGRLLATATSGCLIIRR